MSGDPSTSPRINRSIAAFTMIILALVVFDAWFVAKLQPSAGDGHRSETPTEYVGTLTRTPYPVLRVEQSGQLKTYLLVADGKRGAGAALGVTPDGSVKLKGLLIARAGLAAIELSADDVGVISETPEIPEPPRELHGSETLEGEIVDSKDWLGATRPGEGHVHKASAGLSIRGGIPPLFVVRGGPVPRVLLLTQSDGSAVLPDTILAYVADRVRLTGTVEKRGDIFVLKADLTTLARIE